MELAFTVIAERPSLQSFQSAMRAWWVWVAEVGLIATSAAAFVATSTRLQNETESGRATVLVASVPSEVTIVVDGQARGYTPAALLLPPCEHRVTVRNDVYDDAAYQPSLDGGQVASIKVVLRLETPLVQQLRPPSRSQASSRLTSFSMAGSPSQLRCRPATNASCG